MLHVIDKYLREASKSPEKKSEMQLTIGKIFIIYVKFC